MFDIGQLHGDKRQKLPSQRRNSLPETLQQFLVAPREFAEKLARLCHAFTRYNYLQETGQILHGQTCLITIRILLSYISIDLKSSL